MKKNKQNGRKIFVRGARFPNDDTNDDETYPPLKPAQERAWLGSNAVHFEKHKRPHRWHQND